MKYSALVLLVLFFLFSSYHHARAEEPVRVAVLTDMSGPYSAITASNVDAARMAIDDFGGMLLGQKIEFFFRDFQLKPELANQMASELYEKEKVDAIFDCPNSIAALAVSNKARLNKKLFFSITSGTTRHTGKDCNRYTFDWCYNTYMQANTVGAWAADHIGKKWFAVTADYEWGHDLLKHFKDTLEKKQGILLGNEMLPLGTTDFSRSLLKVKEAQPDVLLVLNAGRDTISLLKDALKMGIKEKTACILPSLYIGGVEEAGEDIFAGDYGVVSWYWEMDNPGSKKFVEQWFKKFNQAPSTFNAGTYSAVTQFLKAVKRAGTKEMKQVIPQLEGHTFTDIFANPGYIRAEDHMQVGAAYVVKVKKAKEITKPQAFFEIVGKISAKDAYIDLKDSECTMDGF